MNGNKNLLNVTNKIITLNVCKNFVLHSSNTFDLPSIELIPKTSTNMVTKYVAVF
ncbi:hypothetical protein WN51_07891 [Melipona quadrifasciata]|uniref:Uncharacterized protein n=1 Tax=Melipona quadrifasciata TaxID=166423 RepID=A0A0N0BJ11_9HYME|nr:hypothetical protein WN51_07891 [Melipona quadrifasciata]